MNLDSVRLEIESLINQRVLVHVSGSRNRKEVYQGIINQVYSNVFTLLVDGVNKSFSYADVAIGDVKIYPN